MRTHGGCMDPVMSVSVAIVEDHPLFRQVLEEIVLATPTLELVGAFPSVTAALAKLSVAAPDVVLLDLGLPRVGGHELLGYITANGLATRCLVLSGQVTAEEAYRVIEAGAAGVLSKSAERDEVVAAIHSVAAGEVVLGSEIQRGIAGQIRQRRANEDVVHLTDRELSVLELAATGLGNEEIGRRIHLSQATVKAHLRHAFDKLGARDRASAVAEAIRRGLID